MPDHSVNRLEMIAAARLRVTIDQRLGRPTPPGVIRLSLSSDDLDTAESRQAKDSGLKWAGTTRAATTPSQPRYLTATLSAIPLLLVIVLESWWRADSPVPLLVAIAAAVVAGVLPVLLLGRLLSSGILSAASPALLTGTWLGLVPGSVGEITGANAVGTAVITAVVAAALIALLGRIQTAVALPRFTTRPIDGSPYGAPIGLHPLVRYGMAAAGYGTGAVLHSVLTGWPMSGNGFEVAMSVVTSVVTALAYTVAVIGIPLATTLLLHRPPRFGPAAAGTMVVLLTLWQLAPLGGSWWQLAGCAVVLVAGGSLAYLVRVTVLPLDGYEERPIANM